MSENDTKDGEEEELWNSWNSTQPAKLMVDGLGIHEVFAAIKKQLELLRRKQSRFQEDLDHIADDVAERVTITAASASSPTASTRSNNKPGSAAAQPVIDAITSAAVTELIEKNNEKLVEMIQSLRNENDELRREVHNLSSLPQKLTTTEATLIDRIRELERHTETLLMKNHEQKLEMQEQSHRIEQLEAKMDSRIDKLDQDIQQKLAAMELHNMLQMKEVDGRFVVLKDVLAVQDLRAKQLDTRISKASEEVSEVQHNLQTLVHSDLETIRTNIGDLFENKAERVEVDRKVSIEALDLKASVFDLNRLREMAEELERRLTTLTCETSDRFQGVDGKLDRRSDRIVTWCLKQLRKELRAMTSDALDKPGTDIGKVRCLVCDHVSTQYRDTDIVHTSGQGLVNTLRAQQHQQRKDRSPSPPPGGGTLPQSPDRFGEATNAAMLTNIISQAAGLPSHAVTNGQQAGNMGANANVQPHSRLVRMGGVPEMHDDDDDDPDYYTDINKAQTHVSKSTKLPSTTSNVSANNNAGHLPHSQSAPLIQIISHHPADSGHVRLSQMPYHQHQQLQLQQQQQQQIAGYYKEMDQKYGTKHTVTVPNINPAPGARPGSAPIKRSNTTSKLQPMGKVVY